MKIRQRILHVLVVPLFILMMVGCGNNDHENNDYMALLAETNPTPTNIVSGSNNVTADEIMKDVQELDPIYDVAVIKGEKEDLVVYKVKHLQRFHMKKIEKDVTTMLEKKYPDENFVVSSDYKIFLEVVRLSKKMKDPSYTKEKAQKELDRIIKLKKELT